MPPVAAIVAGSPGLLVSEKIASGVTPDTEAATEYAPAVLFAVNICDVAMPDALVTAVLTPPAKVPVAPVAGALKITVTPETGALAASLTATLSGKPNAVLITAD